MENLNFVFFFFLFLSLEFKHYGFKYRSFNILFGFLFYNNCTLLHISNAFNLFPFFFVVIWQLFTKMSLPICENFLIESGLQPIKGRHRMTKYLCTHDNSLLTDGLRNCTAAAVILLYNTRLTATTALESQRPTYWVASRIHKHWIRIEWNHPHPTILVIRRRRTQTLWMYQNCNRVWVEQEKKPNTHSYTHTSLAHSLLWWMCTKMNEKQHETFCLFSNA